MVVESDDWHPDGWMLEDAAQRNREHPETFEIPPDSLRNSLVIGDLAKLCFRFRDSDGRVLGERMWVMVTAAKEGQYVGVLRNDPLLSDALGYEDVVTFSGEHVADVQVGYANREHPQYSEEWARRLEESPNPHLSLLEV